jgi:hypothetical protein
MRATYERAPKGLGRSEPSPIIEQAEKLGRDERHVGEWCVGAWRKSPTIQKIGYTIRSKRPCDD